MRDPATLWLLWLFATILISSTLNSCGSKQEDLDKIKKLESDVETCELQLSSMQDTCYINESITKSIHSIGHSLGYLDGLDFMECVLNSKKSTDEEVYDECTHFSERNAELK